MTERRLILTIFSSLFIFIAAIWLYLARSESPTSTPLSNNQQFAVLPSNADVRISHSPDAATKSPPRRRADTLAARRDSRPARGPALLPSIAENRAAPPARPSALVLLIQSARHLALQAEAIDESARKLRQSLSSIPLLEFARGARLLAENRPDQALPVFDRLIRDHPRAAEALAAKAKALHALDRTDEALALYQSALDTHPLDASARYNYAVLLTRAGRHADAAEQFHLLLQHDPNHAPACFNLAALAQRDGRISEAREAWERFLRLEPNRSDAWFNLGIIHMDFDDPLQAAYAFQQSALLSPEDSLPLLNAALALLASGDPDAARDALEAARRLAPCDPLVLQPLYTLHHALAQAPIPEAPYHQARACLLREQLDSALEESDSRRRLASIDTSGDSN